MNKGKMKLELNIGVKEVSSKITIYLKKHTDQAIVVCILVIVIIAALLSSFIFYCFALNSKELTDNEIGYKEIKVRAQTEIFDNIEADKNVDSQEKEKLEQVTKNPFK